MLQLILHLTGDYLFQSSWMANEKTRNSFAAFIHAVVYTLPFLLLTQSILALSWIILTHFVIDRFRLIRYFIWLKNFLGPKGYNSSWEECKSTGYPKNVPVWLSTWLMIIADNTLHLILNAIGIAVF
jgi:hypothetical protein